MRCNLRLSAGNRPACHCNQEKKSCDEGALDKDSLINPPCNVGTDASRPVSIISSHTLSREVDSCQSSPLMSFRAAE